MSRQQELKTTILGWGKLWNKFKQRVMWDYPGATSTRVVPILRIPIGTSTREKVLQRDPNDGNSEEQIAGRLVETEENFLEVLNWLKEFGDERVWGHYYPDIYAAASSVLKNETGDPVVLPTLSNIWEERGLVTNDDRTLADIPLGISVTPDEFGDPFSDWRLPISTRSSFTTMVVTNDAEMQARVAHAVAYGVSVYAGRKTPGQESLAVGGAFLHDTSANPLLIQDQLRGSIKLLMYAMRGMHAEVVARQDPNYQSSKYYQPILMLDQLHMAWDQLGDSEKGELVYRMGEIAKLSRTAPGLHLLIACSVKCYVEMQKYQEISELVDNAKMMLGAGMQGAPENPLMLREYRSKKDYWVLG